MIDPIKSLILEATKTSEIKKIQLIQELWSGYGELSRVSLNDRDTPSIIVKLIKYPTDNRHPKGWNSNIGHRRKKKSYQVETTWYQKFNSRIKGAYFPGHIASGDCGGYQYLLLEDLLNNSYRPIVSLEYERVKHCLSWLANFHRSFLGIVPNGLWPIGTYWHLETRPEELQAISDLALKDAAPKIDTILNQAKFQTIVHGDAKLANFLFNDEAAAAVDFQYVGGGVGIKDVAYFLGSVYREEELESLAGDCLDFYFSELNQPEVEEEWRRLYPYAWCDFYRFLLGWSPSHWKINSYSEKMKRKVLECL